MEEDLEKMYFNYISNLIKYFEIENVEGFREAIASHIINQPNMEDEDDVKSWSAYLSKIIFSFTTLSEEEIEKRFKREFLEVKKLAEDFDKNSKEI